MAETLRSGHSGEINDLQRTQLGLIYSAALGMTTVVNDIMELARMGADVGDEPERHFSIREVLETVVRTVRPMAEEKGVEIRLSSPEHDRVRGHDVALSRVLLNLVTNGLKFTEEGWVEISARHVAQHRVEFAVEDTGRGISPENQRVLFRPFRKAVDRKGSFFSGSGLGLTIARRLVRSMDSELEFETEEGRGTRFHFEVELHPVPHY
jgi:signal transduction histidine kinase